MIISLDTETNGIDLAHGARPFFVTTTDDDGVVRFWEWDVDPETRLPDIPRGDIAEVVEVIDAAELIYIHNAKFDVRALAAIGVCVPWPKVRCTLIASHLLASNHPHDLTSCCIEYLGVDIEPHEERIKAITKAARTIVRREYPHWRLADEDVPGMPSVSGTTKRDEDRPWKNDMWLPRALAKVRPDLAQLDSDYLTALSTYANNDSGHTLPLGQEMERIIRHRGYWKVYEHRLHMPRVDADMEIFGVTARGDYTDTTSAEYSMHIAEAEAAMVCIAAEFGHELELAKGAALNDNMRDFFYGAVTQSCPRCTYTKRVKHWNGEHVNEDVCPKCLKYTKNRPGHRHQLITEQRANLALPVVRSKKRQNEGNATLDAEAMKEYLSTLDDGPALEFIELLADKRVHDTALGYMEQYRRYGVPVVDVPGYYRIHCSINPCGTDHLRQSSNSPNLQNVSGESKEISNRMCFGPLPGREWWRMDYKQIEARIPAYESGEPKLVELFDRAGQGPYWGSQYNLVASILYPQEYTRWADMDGGFKKHEPRLYKRAKFFVLARNYGAGKRKGDLLAGFAGASDMIESGLPILAALQAKYLRMAEKLGYVETLPDRSIDPERGYPILASRTEDGRVLSTTPFNYHVSGTACQCKNAAMIRCSDKCAEWREGGFDAHLALEIHDELLFDFPRGATMEENLPLVMELKVLMEQSGADLMPSMPLPVSVEYHTESWAEGVSVV